MRQAKMVLLLATLFGSSTAQPVRDLIQEALAQNPAIRSIGHQIDAAGERASAAGALPAPTLSFEAAQVPTSSADVVGAAISNNLGISQMFMLGGKLSAMSAVERRRSDVLERSMEAAKVQVRGQVRMAYAELWLFDGKIGIRERTLRLLEDLAGATQATVVTNRMRQADLYSIQSEVASERAGLREVRTQRSNREKELNAVLGRDALDRPILTDSASFVSLLLMPDERLVEELTANNPSLAGMDRMKEMNAAEIDAAQKELIPDLMLQGMVMRMPNGMLLTSGPRSSAAIQQSAAGMAMPGSEWMYSVMASITLPFMPWSSDRASAKAAEMRALNLSIDADKESMRRTMVARLRAALDRFRTSDSLVHDYESEILPLVQKSAEAQTAAYLTGQVPITTVLDARRMELMKRDDYLMVVADREMALAEVEMMIGIPIQ